MSLRTRFTDELKTSMRAGDAARTSTLRREAAELYLQGHRPELAAKEEAEILVIEGFLPKQMDQAAMAAAVEAAIAESGAAGPKEMGKVMAALKARHGAALDMSLAGALVKARLS